MANAYYASLLVDKLNRNLDEAERCARTALAMRPSDGGIWDTFAWVLYRKGDYSRALAEELRAIDMVKANQSIKKKALPEALVHLGAMHEKLGHADEARKAYESALVTDSQYLPAKEALRHLDPTQSAPTAPAAPPTAPATVPAHALQVS
jgi:tetratricopeptide (TPR) repeat protein